MTMLALFMVVFCDLYSLFVRDFFEEFWLEFVILVVLGVAGVVGGKLVIMGPMFLS